MPSSSVIKNNQLFNKCKTSLQSLKAKLSKDKLLEFIKSDKAPLKIAALGAILIFIIVIVLFSYLLIFAPESELFKPSSTTTDAELYPEITRTPGKQTSTSQTARAPKPVGTGRKGFTVYGGVKDAPEFKKGFLDPIDPKQNNQQTIIINTEHTAPVNSVTATIKTDSKQEVVNLSLTSGTKTSGTWEGSWTVDDTYLSKYRVHVQAEADSGTQEAEIILR